MNASDADPAAGLDAESVLEGVVHLGDLVEGLYGPDGRYKLLDTENGTVVASDLHRMLDELVVDHPGSFIVANAAVEQKETTGDGSMTLVLLARGLAIRAQELLDDGFHRTTVTQGYDEARRAALDALGDLGTDLDNLQDPRARAAVRAVLGQSGRSESVVDAAIDAAELVASARHATAGGLTLDQIEFRQVPTSDAPTVELLRGVFLDKEPVTETTPTQVTSPRIAVIGGGKKAGTGIEERELRTMGGSAGKGRTEVEIDASSPEALEAFRQYEADDVDRQVQRLVDADVDAVFTTMGISDRAVARLEAAGIVACRNLMPDSARRIARATGGSVVMHLDDLDADDVGTAGSLAVESHDDETYIRIDGCDAGNVGTLLVSGAIEAGTVAFQRDVMTAAVTGLAILDGGAVVPGGGGALTHLAAEVRDASTGVPDRRALVMEAYADALEDVTRTLARNAGADVLDVTTQLRAGGPDAVFDSDSREVRPAGDAGPYDLRTVVERALDSATSVVAQLVRVDDVLAADRPDEDAPEEDYNFQPDPERDLA